MKRPLDIAVISDIHLGTKGCRAKELHDYLKSIKPEILVLNGNILDIRSFRKKHFKPKQLLILQRLLKMAMNGVKIYYLVGSEDQMLNRFAGFDNGYIYLQNELVLELGGKKHWFTNGDMLEDHAGEITGWRKAAYNFRTWCHHQFQKLSSLTGNPAASIFTATRPVGDFQKNAVRLASERHFDAVVCGHTHVPKISTGPVTYLNSGDWVENLTALEYRKGAWSLFVYDKLDFEILNPKLHVKETASYESPSLRLSELVY